ncbi:MAG: hypothetical protein M3Q16_02590 [Pseudomonadota bacterium]|nr:hypothetical protein [Pseudomonadota bacterium]
MAKITVMYYDSYSSEENDAVRSKGPATLNAIEYLKATPILETAQQVDDAWLDENGLLKDEYL